MPSLHHQANLYSAGAIVRHHSPFDSLPSHHNAGDLPDEIIDRWVAPYYMNIAASDDTAWVESVGEIREAITPEICHLLLGEANWRTRLVGAYFAAVKHYPAFIDIIGTHLLKSEVCCVGHIYALVLAFFNTEQAIRYLTDYLAYYLTRPDLYFDQKVVLEAVLYADNINGTSLINPHLSQWNTFRKAQVVREQQEARETAKRVAEQAGQSAANDYLRIVQAQATNAESLSTTFFDAQTVILRRLNRDSR